MSALPILALGAVVELALGAGPGVVPRARASTSAPASLDTTYGRLALALAFGASRGPFDATVRFAARPKGAMVALTSDGIALFGAEGRRLSLKVVGARRGIDPVGEDMLPGKANYFIGNQPNRWVVGVS